MLNSTRNNSQLQSEKGLLEKILQIKKIHNIYTQTAVVFIALNFESPKQKIIISLYMLLIAFLQIL